MFGRMNKMRKKDRTFLVPARLLSLLLALSMAAGPFTAAAQTTGRTPNSSVHGTAVRETTVHETSVHETAVHETAVHEMPMRSAVVQEALVKESAVKPAGQADSAGNKTSALDQAKKKLPKPDLSGIDWNAEKEKLREAVRTMDELGLSPEKIVRHIGIFFDGKDNKEQIDGFFKGIRRKVQEFIGKKSGSGSDADSETGTGKENGETGGGPENGSGQPMGNESGQSTGNGTGQSAENGSGQSTENGSGQSAENGSGQSTGNGSAESGEKDPVNTMTDEAKKVTDKVTEEVAEEAAKKVREAADRAGEEMKKKAVEEIMKNF